MASTLVIACLLFIVLLDALDASIHVNEAEALKKLFKTMLSGSPKNNHEVPFVSLDQHKVPHNIGSKAEDKIVKLPGQTETVNFNQYSGYVTVDSKAGRALFYYLAEAAGKKHKSKPLLLWLNGGPGLSSLGNGAMKEIGPFRVNSDGKTLQKNPFAWNKVANVLFVESPAGVGFSYSNTTSDYKLSGDKVTAEDTYVFLVNWYERFPEYKGKEFYIAGESYAGHYAPQLAVIILQRNKMANSTMINLKGIAMGNAVTNYVTDLMGNFDFLWSHAIISDEVIDKIHKYCGIHSTDSKSCEVAVQEAYDNLFPINPFGIYTPLCVSPHLTDVPNNASVIDPCMNVYVVNYLNLPEVQEALHANVTKLNYPWSLYSKRIDGWRDSAWSTLPLVEEVMAQGVRVYFYSGDTDAVVSVTSTRYSLKKLRLTIETPWRPWFTDNEVGGYTVAYGGNLTFATVRGAGHEVPVYKPSKALAIVKSFITGIALPTS